MSENYSNERYHRQVILKEFGEAGQEKLRQAKALVIGAGGLGCPALQYLVGAGVGTIGIADDDVVSLSNLHRQPLYSTADVGLSKAETANARLHELNPETKIVVHNERVNVSNALELLEEYDLVIDGSDNFATRYLVNDACVLLGKPLIYGAVSRFEGQVSVFNYKTDDGTRPVNYRDLFPQPPAEHEILNCAEAGVLGVLPGIIGTMQAAEAIKLITGIGKPLAGRLFTYDVLTNQAYEINLVSRKETVSLIPSSAAEFKATDYEWLCGSIGQSFEIGNDVFDELLDKSNVLIVDVREEGELPLVTEFDHIRIPLATVNNMDLPNGIDTIVAFCQVGKRSLQAVMQLAGKNGFPEKIYSLKNGIVQWKQYHQKELV